MNHHSTTLAGVGIFAAFLTIVSALIWVAGVTRVHADDPASEEVADNSRDAGSRTMPRGDAHDGKRARKLGTLKMLKSDNLERDDSGSLRPSDTSTGGVGFGRVHGLGKVETKCRSESLSKARGGDESACIPRNEPGLEPELELGSPDTGEFCNDESVREVVETKRAALEYCYEKQLRASSGLSGDIDLQWKVGLRGQVETTSIASSTMDSEKVQACVRRVVERMRFPRPDGGLCIVTMTLTFSAGEATEE